MRRLFQYGYLLEKARSCLIPVVENNDFVSLFCNDRQPMARRLFLFWKIIVPRAVMELYPCLCRALAETRHIPEDLAF